MTMLRSTAALLSALAATVLVTGGVPPVGAQATCDWYARTALRQQQLNEERKCGFKGEAWHPDLKAHLAWCASVSPDLWKEQAKARDHQLAQCTRR